MPRRRELKGVAAGLVGSFSSRNNDDGGYRALGKLYTEAEIMGTREIEISLIPRAQRRSALLDRISERYHQMLLRQCDAHRIPLAWVRSVRIRIEFACEVTERHLMRHLAGWGDPFVCECEISDDRSRTYAVRRAGLCAPHSRRWYELELAGSWLRGWFLRHIGR